MDRRAIWESCTPATIERVEELQRAEWAVSNIRGERGQVPPAAPFCPNVRSRARPIIREAGEHGQPPAEVPQLITSKLAHPSVRATPERAAAAAERLEPRKPGPRSG